MISATSFLRSSKSDFGENVGSLWEMMIIGDGWIEIVIGCLGYVALYF